MGVIRFNHKAAPVHKISAAGEIRVCEAGKIYKGNVYLPMIRKCGRALTALLGAAAYFAFYRKMPVAEKR